MEVITPRVIITPNITIVFLDSFSDILDAKKAKNPGYKGSTQTAKIGADKPAKKEIQKLSNALTIL